MKKRFYDFAHNDTEWKLTLAMFFLLSMHIFQYIDSGFQVYPLIRIIFYLIAIPTMIFVGSKPLPYILFPFAIAVSQTISFDNYTPFVLVYICTRMKKKFSIPMYLLYGVSIVVVCMRHSKSVIHFLIHILGCIGLYALLSLFNYVMKKQIKLDLTDDEEYILYEITYNNRQLKDFDRWKQNTVSKKLAQCCKKNNCKNPKELQEKYKRGINSKYSK